MQLASKMRFVSAQLLALLPTTCTCARLPTPTRWRARLRGALDAGIADGTIKGLSFSQATQANAVFAVLDNAAADRIRERFRFYDWDRAAGEVRWMCSYDTTDDVDGFVTAIREEFARSYGSVGGIVHRISPFTSAVKVVSVLGEVAVVDVRALHAIRVDGGAIEAQ